MTLHDTILSLLALQGVIGAFDVIYHHELRCALPQQLSAAYELRLHAIRSCLYGVVFAGLAWFVWGGAWLFLLWGIVLIEVVLTLMDFVEEDRTRRLPSSERVTHTILAINGGVLFGLLGWLSLDWAELGTGVYWTPSGGLSIALTVMAVGVAASGIRDGFASRALSRSKAPEPFDFGSAAQTFLISGGTGFIGQALVRALLEQGHVPILLARDPLKASMLFQGRVRCITSMDQLDPDSCVDVVVNLAGEKILGHPWSAARKASLIESRVRTTEALVEWTGKTRKKPRVMLSASAVGFYGEQHVDDASVLDEASPGKEGFTTELCQSWENSARKVVELGVPLKLLRLGLVFGGGGGALPPMLLPILLGLGGPLGSGRQIMSWVHLHDVLGVMAWLCRGGASSGNGAEVYNVVAPENPSQREFVAVAARLLRRPAFFKTPEGPLRMLLGEQSCLLLDGQRVSPRRLREEGYAFRFATLSSALADVCGKTPA